MFSKHTGVARAALTLVVALVVSVAVAACGGSDNGGSASSSGGSKAKGFDFLHAGKLTVGMNLQFKPEMYLDNGQPAGYDVDLLKRLAPSLHTSLNIQNIDFNGLIPGLQSHKFDMVSVGLSPTPERKQVVDFTRAYVPYAQVLAVPSAKASSTTSAAQLNQSGKKITALQGSTAEQLAKKLFPKATVDALPDQNAAFLQVATGRADAIVVEDYLLAQFQASNAGKLGKAAISKPLNVEYGSWAVPKGNQSFVSYLNNWLCKAQNNGTLARIYKKDFKVSEMPPMPKC